MNRANIGRRLHDMIAAPAGGSSPRVIFRSEDGVLDCYGTTVPTDGSSDYAVGCTFRQIAADVLYSGACTTVGTATTVTDLTAASTFNTNDELNGLYVVCPVGGKEIMGVITDYNGTTGKITVADWTDYDGTAVANTIYPAVGDTIKVMKVSTPIALFINYGDSYRGSKFRPVIGSELNTLVARDFQVGMASQMWDGAPLLEVMLDPGKGLYHFEDFFPEGDETNVGAEVTQTTGAGTFTDVPSVASGVYILDNAASTNNHCTTVLWPGLQLTPGVGTHIYFEVRVNCTEDAGLYVIGLADDATADVGNSGTIITNKDHAVFFRDSGTTAADMGCQACDGTNTTTADDLCTDVDKTAYETFGIHIYGDGDTAGDYVKFYHKGVLVKTVTDADGDGDDGVPDGIICPILEIDNLTDGAQQKLNIDWMRVLIYNENGDSVRV